MGTRINYIENKIIDSVTAKRRISTWKLKGDKVIFTNGCFDILHKGHVTYLAQAANLGQRLVVGLNTDSSVKRQRKGENRPINNNDARALVLGSLGFVDAIVFFDDDTPLSVIEKLKPDVLVKGADYDPDETNKESKKYIVGSEFIKKNGGEVQAIELVEGFSTSSLIKKMED